MAKYLDYDGLSYLWQKIEEKTKLATKESLRLVITDQLGGGVSTTVTLTVDGISTDYEYNSSPLLIPIVMGSVYTISFKSLEYYITPTDSNTYVADAGTTRELTYIYKYKPIGVWCVDTNFNLYDYNDWDSTKSALGVAVITDNTSFIIGYRSNYVTGTSYDESTNTENYLKGPWGNCQTNVPGCTLTSSLEEALLDFNGKANTKAMCDSHAGVGSTWNGDINPSKAKYWGAPAASQCYFYYSRGSIGRNNWWLPSVGEMNTIINNIDLINNCVQKLGSQFLHTNNGCSIYYWTSTQYDVGYAWSWQNFYYDHTYTNTFDKHSKYSYNNIIPITTL